MDPLIDLGARQLRLSAIRHDTQSRAAALAHLHQTKQHVGCCCVRPPVVMGIAMRKDSAPTYYLYHLRHGDSAQHAPECPHRLEAITVPLSQPHVDANEQEVDLVGADPSIIMMHTDQLAPRKVEAVAKSSLAGLPALLDAVVHAAGLNVWRPGFLAHRNYFQARFRLIEASKRIRPFGTITLADILFMPPVWDPLRAADINYEWDALLQQLRATDEHIIPRGVIMGRVRSIERKPNWSAPQLKLSGWKSPLWLDGCPALIEEPPTDQCTWLAMLVFEAQGGAGKIQIVDGAAIRMTPNWIPVHSHRHAELANDLVRRGVPFKGSLHSDPETAWAVPDIVLLTGGGLGKRLSADNEGPHLQTLRAESFNRPAPDQVRHS